MTGSLKKKAQCFLNCTDIKIGGNRDWDVRIKDDIVYKKVFSQGSIGFGETYMCGLWECNALDKFFERILKARIDKKFSKKEIILNYLKAKILNRQRIPKSHIVGEQHYDIGNDLYELMLDKHMQYSCAYWKKAKTLEQAQEAKLDLICRKIKLKKGMKILDIGCGWGGFAKYASKKYKVKVVGVTISKEQAKYAQKLCKGLDVDIKLTDYRALNEKFDRIVSIGMFEHVGSKNYKEFMKVADRCLINDGLFLLHTIGGNKSVSTTDPWIDKYIFPNSHLPSAKQITKSYEGIFKLEDWHNFGKDYDKTLMEWHKRFNQNWNKINKNYSEEFRRMWNYYLLSCAACFRVSKGQLWQIVFTKIDSTIDYESER